MTEPGTEIVRQMLDSINDLDTLTEMASIVPAPPTDIQDAFALVSKTWSLGKVFKEHALALVARSSIDQTFKSSTRIDGVCQVCGYIYQDIEIEIPPLTCSECGLFFSEIPLKRNRVRRYHSWEEFEKVLIEELDMSHGVIGSRISLYKRMLAIGMAWQEAYDAILKSPTYCEKLLTAFDWDSRGNLVRVPDSVVLPADIKDETGKRKLQKTGEFLKEKIINETEIIDGRHIKSAMIQNVRELSGKPIVTVYHGNPHGDFELVMTVAQAIDENTTVESVYRFRVFDESGSRLASLPRDVQEAIVDEFRTKSPNPMQRKEFWRS
jgi:hypothetical protein